MGPPSDSDPLKEDGFVKSRQPLFSSFRRKPESRKNKHFWTQAFAGVTALKTFYEAVKEGRTIKEMIRNVHEDFR
jgi:hypothetical protein